MKPAGMTLCIVILLACCFFYIENDGTSMMQGDILYVGGSGPGNYSSVQAALDAAADGDTVYVYDDSAPYSERVVVTASIHMTGENHTTTIIDGGGMGSVVTVAAPDVVVSTLTVRNSGANGSTRGGILLESTGCIVRNVVLRDNEYGVICRGDDHHVAANLAQQNIGGVYIQDATGCLVEENMLDGNQLMGIALLQDTTDNIIKNNRVMNGSTGQGILVGGTGNRIEGNVVSDQQYGGLQLLSSGNVVVNNSFFSCGLGTMYDYQSNVLHGNTVNGKPLIYLEDTSDVTVEHAGQVFLVHCTGITAQGLQLSNTTVAVQLFESSSCHIRDNEISGNLEGVMLWNASDNTISGNDILDNVFEGVNVGPFSHRTLITGNVISGNNRGIYLWSEENTVTDNT
ncbi:MAG: right-handed parallel beta-helix repeat-containing protein, partial [Thermoplasmatota archaeon]